jgi:hypothetical protein
MKASVSITFTRHTGRFSRRERAEQADFDDDQLSFIEAASSVIDTLEPFVKDARSRRR